MSTPNTSPAVQQETGRLIRTNDAIAEALAQEMARDDNVFVFGLDVDDHLRIKGSTAGLVEKFGADRCFGTPLSEDAMTGIAIGAAMAGMRPVHVHIRMDFTLLSMNQLINMAAKAHYMYNGQVKVPLVVRCTIGRSWGQGAQHSQALQSLFMHIPGLKVVAPTNAYDAKGILAAAIRDNNPVIFIEHALLSGMQSYVPEEPYIVPLGQARTLVEGSDITIVATSHMVVEAVRASKLLKEVGINATVIDPVTLRPLDMPAILASAEKTGHLLVVDNAWLTCGASAEILAQVAERGTNIKMSRMGFAETTCPTTRCLEDEFYPNAQRIALRVYQMLKPGANGWIPPANAQPEINEFKGPF